jgi:hypothetical protein
MDSAIAASIVRAQVKRASLAFTTYLPSWDEGQALLGRQPGGLGEIPGFASPPRDGFAFDSTVRAEWTVPLTRDAIQHDARFK